MNAFNIQLPPMPKPEDFGITQDDWEHPNNVPGAVKFKAYYAALEAWKQAASSALPR